MLKSQPPVVRLVVVINSGFMLLPALSHKVDALINTFGQISPERIAQLESLAAYIRLRWKERLPVNLVFICTHNSRRSHMAQVWSQAAATYYGLTNIRTYSGGTEVTAFHPNAVRALAASGFTMEAVTSGNNPIYKISVADGVSWEVCSKRYDDITLPHTSFAAIMTCSDADAACPFVPGADARFPIRYQDPKISDGTPQESATYALRADEIGREMLYVMRAAGER
ncbi:MAG TPA: protein-tyrosine-phosphatase [Cytophagales bacterium]|nr:protein-tyrosine-phosphatase [Cytophagales bacterium]